MEQEWENFKGWITAPFSTQVPMWQAILIFVLFVIIAYFVVDNLEILKMGLQS
jgi:hypothetical protein